MKISVPLSVSYSPEVFVDLQLPESCTIERRGGLGKGIIWIRNKVLYRSTTSFHRWIKSFKYEYEIIAILTASE